MDTIRVTCGLILDDKNKIFVCRRGVHKDLAGYWEYPGGKIEPDEKPEDCLARELLEELGMTVSVGNHFRTVLHDYSDFRIELLAYFCRFESCTFNMVDHDRFEWCGSKDLPKRNMAPADVPITEALLELAILDS